MSRQYHIIPVTQFAQFTENCSILWCDETLACAVVDPGGDLPKIEAAIVERGLTLTKILLTHGHIDHAGGTGAMMNRLNLPVEGPQREESF